MNGIEAVHRRAGWAGLGWGRKVLAGIQDRFLPVLSHLVLLNWNLENGSGKYKKDGRKLHWGHARECPIENFAFNSAIAPHHPTELLL
jgi:hypothetical protein